MSVNEKMTAIADRIRNYTGGTRKLTLDDMPEEIGMVMLSGYNNGFTEGVQSGYTTGYDEGKMQGIDEGYTAVIEEINPELLEIISIQESYIYPTILFYFDGTEYHLQESEAYWTDKLSFGTDWMEPTPIWNDKGYAKWEYYSIVDSQNNLIKYNDTIKDLETYRTSGLMEFFIQCNDGNKYTIKFENWDGGVSLENITDDNRFTPTRDDNYNYSGCYFTPEENGKKYFISPEYSYINLGDTVNATLVEGGNE